MKNVLVTDNLFYPLGMDDENTEVYTWHDFIELANDGFDMDSDVILFDVANLDESLYEEIIQWRQVLSDNIKFITYDEYYDKYTPPFLENEVIIKVKTSDIQIKKLVRNKNVEYFDENKLLVRDNFLVYTTDRKLASNCDIMNVANNFLIEITQQLKVKNIEIVYMNDYTTKFENCFENKIIGSPKELAEELVKIKQEVNDRIQLIEKYDSNTTDEQYKIRTIYDLPKDVMPKIKFYILDNLVDILKSADTESMDIISGVIDTMFLFHMSRIAGIHLILVVDDTDPLIELLFRPKEDKRAIFDQIVFIDGSSFFMSRAFNISEKEAAEILSKKTNEDIVISTKLRTHCVPVISKICYITYSQYS